MGPWNPVHAGKNAVTLPVTPLKSGSTPATAGKNAATLPVTPLKAGLLSLNPRHRGLLSLHQS